MFQELIDPDLKTSCSPLRISAMPYSAFGYLGLHIFLSVRSLSAPAARTRCTPYGHLPATSLRPDPLDPNSTSFTFAIHSTYPIYVGGLLHML